MKEEFKNCLNLCVYQIYPRSFCDTNNDGIGDLNGIIKKLEYIKNLGANAIWICPIYKSPQKDNGYDISDYRELNPEYGTMEDFDNLVKKCHEMKIKVIMDLVANHTSSEHYWFKQAKQSKNNPYHDFYYWADKPLTDWNACFGGSAWEYNAETNEYYLHSFAVEQPDVNWNNPKVRKEFCDIVDFWVAKGVDGFRCDVLDFISKDFYTNKMLNGPKLHDYIKEIFGRKGLENIFTIGECQSDENSICDICGQDRNELKCVFQFEHFGIGRIDKNTPCEFKLDQLKEILIKWQHFTKKHDLLYVLLTDNHDQPWYNSRIGNDKNYRYESSTMLATAIYCLKGIPFVYQGQEIGSANSNFNDITNFNDIETINYYNYNKKSYVHDELMQKVNYGSRDNSRRPFAWTNDCNFGFTESDKPWLEYSNRSNEINLENDLNSEKSICKYYSRLLNLRQSYESLLYGDFEVFINKSGCFIYKRILGNNEVLVVCNFEKENFISEIPSNYRLLLSNNSKRLSANGIYAPYECAIFELIK